MVILCPCHICSQVQVILHASSSIYKTSGYVIQNLQFIRVVLRIGDSYFSIVSREIRRKACPGVRMARELDAINSVLRRENKHVHRSDITALPG